MLIPFMEFLLPVALRVFPNMLPSTFQVLVNTMNNDWSTGHVEVDVWGSVPKIAWFRSLIHFVRSGIHVTLHFIT